MNTPTGWQPIATAPRDNKRPLYLARFDKKGVLQHLDFDGGWEFWQESWEMPHINGYDWVSANGIEEPTHWAYQDGPPPPSAVMSQRLRDDRSGALLREQFDLDRRVRQRLADARNWTQEDRDAHGADLDRRETLREEIRRHLGD